MFVRSDQACKRGSLLCFARLGVVSFCVGPCANRHLTDHPAIFDFVSCVYVVYMCYCLV